MAVRQRKGKMSSRCTSGYLRRRGGVLAALVSVLCHAFVGIVALPLMAGPHSSADAAGYPICGAVDGPGTGHRESGGKSLPACQECPLCAAAAHATAWLPPDIPSVFKALGQTGGALGRVDRSDLSASVAEAASPRGPPAEPARV